MKTKFKLTLLKPDQMTFEGAGKVLFLPVQTFVLVVAPDIVRVIYSCFCFFVVNAQTVLVIKFSMNCMDKNLPYLLL